MMRLLLSAICLTGLSISASAQDWQPITKELIASEKPGFGGVCGVVVDHATGELIINLSDRGFYRSVDQGKSWQKLGAPFNSTALDDVCTQTANTWVG